MGDRPAERRAVLALAADVRRPRLRRLPELPRFPAPGPAAGHASAPVHAPGTLSVQRRRDRRADPGRAGCHGPAVTATYQTLIGLLAITGCRPGEACRLDREHFSPRDRTLTIVRSKYGKSRQLLLDPTTVTALEEYGRHRDRLHPHPAEPSLLVSMQGTRMDIIPTERVFARLTRAAGIVPLSDRTRPTMKNLRHTFAVSTLISWYRSGADVEARLPPCPRGSVTSILRPRTGTCKPARSFSPSPPGGPGKAPTTRRNRHERSRSHPAGLLHRPDDHPEARQRAHDPLLPGTPGGCCWPSPRKLPAPRRGNWTSDSSTPA